MTPKDECEELMNANLPFASKCLNKYGEFYPFGAVIETDRKISLTAPYDGNDMPESKDVIEKLENIHKNLFKNGEIIASSIIYDSKININNNINDAIIVSLEHINNYSVKIAFPYNIKKGLLKRKVTIYEPIAFEGDKKIF